MSDLVEFLRARLDEDERRARLALNAGDGFLDAEPAEFWYDSEGRSWLPGRVLAEVEAKRRIIERDWSDLDDGWYDGWYVQADTLKLLALPYADHLDYREEWRPWDLPEAGSHGSMATEPRPVKGGDDE